eukprot:scaffold81933_cov28-Tisochrysis_lutea.AAC.8
MFDQLELSEFLFSPDSVRARAGSLVQKPRRKTDSGGTWGSSESAFRYSAPSTGSVESNDDTQGSQAREPTADAEGAESTVRWALSDTSPYEVQWERLEREMMREDSEQVCSHCGLILTQSTSTFCWRRWFPSEIAVGVPTVESDGAAIPRQGSF